MNRRDFLKSAAAGGLAAAGMVRGGEARAAESPSLKGRVTGGGKPLAGVIVSDGLACTKTAADGTWSLPPRNGARFVRVTAPSGFRPTGNYLRIPDRSGVYDINLWPWAEGAKKGCRFVQVTDSEINGASDYEAWWIEDLKQLSAEKNVTFIVHTGDIDSRNGLLAHHQMMNNWSMKRPTLYCLGNHDMCAGAYGEELFESLFGPCWHSFEVGGIHFAALPMTYGDYPQSYKNADYLAWLRNDLALVPKDRPVVVFSHMFYKDYRFLAEHNWTGFVYGHVHHNFFRREGKLALVATSTPQKGGIDASPATVRIIDVAADGRLTSQSHYLHAEGWKADRAGAVWETKLEAGPLFGTPAVAGGKLFVGLCDDDGNGLGGVAALQLADGKVLWRTKTVNSVRSQPVVADGRVIVQDAEGFVYAYEAKSGRELWRRQVSDHKEYQVHYSEYVITSGVTVAGGTVYAGGGEKLTALDLKTGKVLWRIAEARGVEPSPSAPAVAVGKVFAMLNWWGSFCVDAKTGKTIWEKKARRDPRYFPAATPVIRDGIARFTAENSYAEVDLKTGELVREKKFDRFRLQVPSKLVETEKYYLFGSAEKGLVALDRKTLEIAWTALPDNCELAVSPYSRRCLKTVASQAVLLPENRVAATGADGAVYVWNLADGKRLKKLATGAPYFAGAVYADGLLVAVDMAGYARAFRI